MASKPAKAHANVRVRRHSSSTTSSSRPKKLHSSKHKHKDSDSASIATSSSTSTSTLPSASEARCPLRSLLHLTGLLGSPGETDEEEAKQGCPLRRAQLWHTIPLCILAIINLLLIIVALLGLASYRIVIGAGNVVETTVRTAFGSEYPLLARQYEAQELREKKK